MVDGVSKGKVLGDDNGDDDDVIVVDSEEELATVTRVIEQARQ
jgi:hypothetical protein